MAPPWLVSFTTESVADEDRVVSWEQHNARSLIGLTCATPDQQWFRAREINLALPRMRVAAVTATPHAVRRDRRHIAESPCGALAVYVATTEGGMFSSGGQAGLLRAGDVLVLDADRPFVRGFATVLAELALSVPYAALADGPGSRPGPSLIQKSTSRQTGLLVDALTGLAARALKTPPEDRAAGERDLITILRALLTRRPEDPLALTRLLAVDVVLRRLTDRSMSAPQVAATVGVSERQLSRAFASAGESYPRLVLRERLERAHAELAAAAPGTSVAAVAAGCGFTAPAHFSRAFVTEYGQTPREVLIDAQHVAGG